MSLDITLTNRKTNEEVASMNWLRNPYGLCRWAEDNIDIIEGASSDVVNLHFVCNNWAYSKGKDIDRKLFKQVIDTYWEKIQKLERGYYAFDLASYMSFVQPRFELFPHTVIFGQLSIEEAKFLPDRRLAIPMEYFNKPIFNLGHCSLENYKNWFKELVDFAELLQDEDNEFDCSN